ncbi:hypothetical protein CU254_31760 [Amycolatopsis sp. AA4]|uniref:hypothetical protein n=1 Tax=Actinomycetes TaxID=1760 RepID=UPI0001B54632|nr:MULTISPECIES: hypothetical protein [Actinomycetes]ATY14487.1 hypothetical protein CU254_31760 [Amycolatopsis sp. AA4]EFL10581.1 predicted protein [Streptomyces sp. AA4]
MSKGGYSAVQIVGMVITVVSAQAAIRSFFDHEARQLWGAFSWVPGGWGGQLAALVVLVLLGMAITSWAHDRAKTKS